MGTEIVEVMMLRKGMPSANPKEALKSSDSCEVSESKTDTHVLGKSPGGRKIQTGNVQWDSTKGSLIDFAELQYEGAT
jgi:hypothetical protein